MRALGRTWRAAWQEAFANRRGFWTQVAIMVVNDMVWVIFWVLFFDRVGELRGWGVDQVLVLFATLATAAGIVLGLFNNLRRIPELAATGGLDALLALPVRPLRHLASRRVQTANVGDLFFGVGLFLAAGSPTPSRLGLFALGVLCATLTLSGFLVILGSLSFLGARTEASELGFHAIVLFANYPVDLFGGLAKFFLYAIVPAAFVSTVPARLVNRFDVGTALLLVAVSGTIALAARIVFHAGLRRYTSGSTWTSA